ncbi:MAG: serine/threonine protein kinase [Acidimicrobiaceae bacterium]|nr:serine/threonine protein kinase [Acidimicrobiaceae bacterium]
MRDQPEELEKSDVNDRVINGRYRLLSRIGAGAMGDVYKAQDLKLDREIAIKLLKNSFIDDKITRARFEREARAAGKLSHHPNVITVFDVDESDGQPFIAMELVTGGTLSSVLKSGPLPVEQALFITRQILRALAFAHQNGIIHRDIKPSNILMTATGEVKVGDFGIASIYEGAGGEDLTLSSQFIGTPAYLSPERVESKPVTPSSDIFSVGVILYEMVTGERPFKGDSPIAIILSVRSGTFISPELINPYIPAEVTRVIKRALVTSREDRYSSAQHMAAALDFSREPNDTAPENTQLLDKPFNPGVETTLVGGMGLFQATEVGSTTGFGDKVGRNLGILNDRDHGIQIWLRSAFAVAIGLLLAVWRWVASNSKQRLSNRTGGALNSSLIMVVVALVAFVIVALLMFGNSPASSPKGNPTTSLPTTSTVSTLAPTTTTPPNPAPVPPGRAKKLH